MNDGAFFYITVVENLYFFHQGGSSRIYLISTCNNNNHNNNNNNNNNNHCIKSVCILSYSGPYSVRMRENTDQKNFESGHFSCSESVSFWLAKTVYMYGIRLSHSFEIPFISNEKRSILIKSLGFRSKNSVYQ